MLFQGLISVVSGILITQMSLLGRIGIHTMYRQFLVFRSWWKTALLFFAAQCLLLALLYGVRKAMRLSSAKKVAWILLLIGILGAGTTYWDFSHTMQFHFGFYLFWLGWAVSCLYFISLKGEERKVTNEEQEKVKEVKNEE